MNNKNIYCENKTENSYRNVHEIVIIKGIVKQDQEGIMKLTRNGCKNKLEIDTEIFQKKGKKSKKTEDTDIKIFLRR